MPVLAVGAEKAFGAVPAAFFRSVATDVREVVLPSVGHWLLEECPDAIIRLVRDFFQEK